PSLARAIGIVAEKDAGAFRQSVFGTLARQRLTVRLARAVHDRLGTGALGGLLVTAYGAKCYLAVDRPTERREVLAVAAYPNERRQLDRVDGAIGGGKLSCIDISNRALLRPGTYRALRTLPMRELFAIVRARRDADFLVACRVASTAGYYFRFRELLARDAPAAILTSSDSNPYAMALVAAARERAIPTAYVAHGHIPEGPPRLWYDLSFVDGKETLGVYERSRGYEGRVVFRGAEGEYRPMMLEALERGRPLRVGVFASLIVDWTRFVGVVRAIHDAVAPSRLLVRLHPNPVIRDPSAERRLAALPYVEVSRGESVLTRDAASVDLVIAGNTSAHLSVLKHGVPSVYLPGLDLVPHDFYRFLERRIVPEVAAADALAPRDLAAFFRDPDWARRFAQFDAGYGRSSAELDAEVARAMRALLGGEDLCA
ncbi:MAG: hypothetical protein AB7P00_42895, partial [Sandaracinaceae bacterium]